MDTNGFRRLVTFIRTSRDEALAELEKFTPHTWLAGYARGRATSYELCADWIEGECKVQEGGDNVG